MSKRRPQPPSVAHDPSVTSHELHAEGDSATMKPASAGSEGRWIRIRGAKVHNLRSVDVDLPRNNLIVVTGVSGSGKSSLAFDTLYAEGQRRFVESLSSYARQFLDRMQKPDVDRISGLPPAVAIEQQTFSRNPRSTVGTVTEVYDYLRLLYGRVGIVIDKDTGEIVRKDTPEYAASTILEQRNDDRLFVLAELPSEHASISAVREALAERGFTRIVIGESTEITELEGLSSLPSDATRMYVLVDRLQVRQDEDTRSRLTDSLESAFAVGDGRVIARSLGKGPEHDLYFSTRFEASRTRTQYIEPEPRLFSFNNPFGACPVCQGFGRSVGIDMNLVVPDPSLSLKRGALHPFRGEVFSSHLRSLLREATKAGINVNAPYCDLTADEASLVMNGVGEYVGVTKFFRMLEDKSYKTHYRVMLSRYRGYTTCSACDGSRLRTAARQVFVGGVNLPTVVHMTLEEARAHFERLQLTPAHEDIAGAILHEIRARLQLLCDIGLEYLTLDRLSHTLSGGESQRINLATSLGSALVGTLYVLDEPSIGLHPRDTDRLLSILQKLRSRGNTVVVVEHDMEIIQAADVVVDVGPLAGEHGGTIVFAGPRPELLAHPTSLTAQYLRGERHVSIRDQPRKPAKKHITIRKPKYHNLKGDDVQIPLERLTVVTGVSGSGKSSLVHGVLYGNVARIFGGNPAEVGHCDGIEGLANIEGVELIDQSPIGRSTRSTPATYTKIFDLVRDVYASTQAARQHGWRAGHFSFNVKGGRCDTCEGEGSVTIEMQFLPDIELPCESCHGTRYKKEALSILYNGKSIVDVLQMTVNEAIVHFAEYPRIVSKLQVLADVGLSYLRLGQSSTHLSGGEAQRLKLASHLDTQQATQRLFIFDEPTTGLHLHDVSALLSCFQRLVDAGHTVILIEHHLHVIAAADWVIDLGPEGGSGGGHVVAVGTPKQIMKAKGSHTGTALRTFMTMLPSQPQESST